MKAGDILIAGGLTVGVMTFTGSLTADESHPGLEEIRTCTEEERAALHQLLLEQGLLEMEGILLDSCSDIYHTQDLKFRVGEDNPKPKDVK